MTAYRKKKGNDTWHWHQDCSNWPESDYKEIHSKPRKGEFCGHCRTKDKQMIRLFHPVR